MPDATCRAEIMSKITSFLSYLTGGALVVGGDLLGFLNTNASACGVLLGFGTFLVNWYYQRKMAYARMKALGEENQ